VTVLVSDLRGFSPLAERLGPQPVCRLIRDMLARLSNRIVENKGLIVDYAGDGILAMWNAPVAQEGHAVLACRAALAMLEEMPGLEADWKDVVCAPLALGIGLNTGVAQVGNTGSTRKFKYGPHGHTVNLASRVQTLSKHLRTPLLVTSATRSRLPAEVPARRLGRAHLTGIASPVELHELRATETAEGWPADRDAYETALTMFEAGRFPEAHQVLSLLLETRRTRDGDIPMKLLFERVSNYLNNPPPAFDPAFDWGANWSAVPIPPPCRKNDIAI